jgi:hypothetical protein
MICAARHEAYGPDDSQRRLSAAQYLSALKQNRPPSNGKPIPIQDSQANN